MMRMGPPQQGATLPGALRGHEHFGFKDGVSQPGIRGVNMPTDPHDPDHGNPGQDLLWPGEFVLGYPTQIPLPPVGHPADANRDPGLVSTAGPAWTADGSFLVFRRLRQDVAGFQAFVEATALQQGISSDVLGAKLIGRYRSGAPLEPTADTAGGVDTTAGDPSLADPAVLDDLRINNFEFGDDPEGALTPRAAHIRKAYPRDSPTPTGGESDTQTHRILRRGIPFGRSYQADAPPNSARGANPQYPNDRGLLFLCYQSSIERQFEFVQQRWFNDPNFPTPGDGHDPIVAQITPRTFELPTSRAGHLTLMQSFVLVTGGEYFFAPSIDTLHWLGKKK